MTDSKKLLLRNRYTFGIGTIGRDMLYSMVSMYLLFYYTDVVGISDTMLAWITGFMVAFRVFDALNDPIMGTIVDNTRSRFGKFKPWIVLGALLSGALTILLFTDFSLDGAGLIAMFAVVYLFWGIAFTTNDIAFWSMMPALSQDQKEREKIGAFARICANLGLFIVVAGIVPITTILGDLCGGNLKMGYLIFAVIVCLILWAGQCVTVFGVKEPKVSTVQPRTTLKGMVKAIFKNDQLLVTAAAMALFMVGYMTTTSFGLYFFKYAYKDESMYSVFAVVLGVSQIIALILFPLFSKKFTRRQLYIASTVMIVVGYILFFFAPMNMIFIGACGLMLFFGQAFIQLLMLVFLADTVEYGDLKLGKRNESVSFAIQPFINKLGGALASGVVGVTLIISGINEASNPADVTEGGLWIMKVAMLVLPLILIVAGFILYLFKYKIDKKTYDGIIEQLKIRDGIIDEGVEQNEDTLSQDEDGDTERGERENAESAQERERPI